MDLGRSGGNAVGMSNFNQGLSAVTDEGGAGPAGVGRVAGWGLIVMSVLTVVFMWMHPTTGTHDAGEFVERAGRGVPGNTFVHGALVTVILMMATCFLWLRDVLGPRRALVRAGLVALVVGTAGAVCAGLVNGFIVPNVAARYVGAGPEDVAALKPVLVMLREANATLARVSVVGLSLTAVAWSSCVLMMPGWRRAAGVIGLLCGLAPLAMHAGEHLRMNVSGYGLFVQIHAVWGVMAGLVMVVRRG